MLKYLFSIENLIYLLTLITAIIMVLLSYAQIGGKKIHSSIPKIIAIVCFSELMVFNNLNSQPFFRAILGFLIVYTVVMIIFKDNVKTAFTIYFLIWLVGISLDLLLGRVVSMSGLINFANLNQKTTIIVKVFFTLLPHLVFLLLLHIKHINHFFQKVFNMLSSNENGMPFSTLVLFFVSLLGAYNNLKINNENAHILVLIMAVCFAIFTWYAIKKYNESLMLEVQNKSLISTNGLYNKLVEEYEDLEHNWNHHLDSLKSIANDDLKNTIEDRIKINQTKHTFITKIQCAPDGIRDLLYIKLEQLQQSSQLISVESDVVPDIIKRISPRAFNYCTEALGVLIDNAKEAVDNSENKIIHIDISCKENYLVIKVINTFSDFIDVDKIGERYYTTKSFGKGIGLNSILKNNKITVENKIINNKYQSSISVKLKKETDLV